MLDYIDKLMIDIIKSTDNKLINIDGWKFYPKIYFKIEGKTNAKDNKDALVEIHNYKDFKVNLDEYLSLARKLYSKDKEYFEFKNDYDFDKYLITFLLINTPSCYTYRFDDYLKFKIDSLNEEKVSVTSKTKIGEFNNLDINAKISLNSAKMEAPYNMEIEISDGKEIFDLPSITFSIIDDTCYLMAIKSKHKGKQTSTLAKHLDRYFRKLGANISCDDSISQVSTNSLVSMILFNSYLKKKGITNLKGFAYYPIRNSGNHNAVVRDLSNVDKRDELLANNDRNQTNMTDKFMNLFARYNYHFEDESEFYFDSILETSNLELFPCLDIKDDLAHRLDNSIKEYEYGKEDKCNSILCIK